MNARIRSLVQTVETSLESRDQDDLAVLMEEFVAARHLPADFTAEERQDLRRIDAEPFIEADRASVAAVFARRA